MFYTIAIILFILWALGATTHMLGSLIHVLLLLAVAAVLIRVIQGRNTL
jgi:hypothetical protein